MVSGYRAAAATWCGDAMVCRRDRLESNSPCGFSTRHSLSTHTNRRTDHPQSCCVAAYGHAFRLEELEEAAYCACRNPTVVCGHAHEEQWVGTRRETSKSSDKLSITFEAERNRCRVVDRLSRCAGVTH
jgi:hypothetical protein